MEPLEPARIRLVTRRFKELQGLRGAVVLATVLAMVWGQPYLRLLRYAGPVPAVLGLMLSVLPAAIVAVSHVWFDRYYRRRFGRVSGGRDTGYTVGALALFAMALWLDTGRTSPSPSAVLLAGTALALHIVVRDWPWRAHYLIAAAVCALGAWTTATVPGLAVRDLDDVVRVSMSIVLLGNLPAAWLDHRLLTTTMPAGGDEAAGADVAIEDARQ